MMMLGAAWQAGHIPVSAHAIGQAITLNGVKVRENRLAFDLGRLMRGNPDIVRAGITPPASGRPAETFADILSDRCARPEKFSRVVAVPSRCAAIDSTAPIVVTPVPPTPVTRMS